MLIEITQQTHPVLIDVRYASPHNFTQKPIYKLNKLLLHQDAVFCLEKAIELAAQLGFVLKLFDGFRPQKAQEILWNAVPDPSYIMPPEKGSVHTRGIAIDLTLFDKENGEDVNMGTPFDDFTVLSHHGAEVSVDALNNRCLLLGIMTAAGFDFYHNEWWHYQLFHPELYPLLTDNFGII